ncbi:unnamed protein product [Ixodes pacificus]
MAGACGSTPGTFGYGPQGRVTLPSPWSTDLTAAPRSFNKCKIEAYRALTLASSCQVARSNKFITEAYVDPASVQVLRSTTGVLIKASCFRSQRKAKVGNLGVEILRLEKMWLYDLNDAD